MVVAGALALRAQTDIPVSYKGPFGDLGRNVAFGTTGPGGLNNAFIINIPSPQNTACVYVHNLSATQAQTITFQAYSTADSRALGYYKSPQVWQQLAGNGAVVTTVNGLLITTSSTASFQVGPVAGSSLAVVFGGGSAGAGFNADVFYSFGGQIPCGASLPQKAHFFWDTRSLAGAANTTVDWFGVYNAASPPEFVAAPSDYQACTFAENTPTLSGGGALAIYIQAIYTNVAITDDRVSFNSIAAGSNTQAASLYLFSNANPHVIATGSLAAGSVVGGNFGDTVAIEYKLTGTAPTANPTVVGWCQ